MHFAGRPKNFVPTVQWLVLLVLMSHLLLDGSSALDPVQIAQLLVGLILSNLVLLYLVPYVLPRNAGIAALVIADTLLVPYTLYLTGTRDVDLFVVYFGIIMIAAASGKLAATMLLTTFTATGYAVLTLLQHPDPSALGSVLVRLPFLLVMTLLYGTLAEHAKREQELKGKIEHAALHDELTGLANRRQLYACLAKILAEAGRSGNPISCIVVDADQFKPINDTYGHDMGDCVLRDLGILLTQNSRTYDVVARLGGDEYVWVLPGEDRNGAVAAGERLRAAVEQYQFGDANATFHMTISIGVATFLAGTVEIPSPALMLKAADEALYLAKSEGKNRLHHRMVGDACQPVAIGIVSV